LRVPGPELGEEVVELIEPDVPGALEGPCPVVEGLEDGTVDPVPPTSPIGADEHEADRPQHAEVLGHLRLAEAEPVYKLAHRDLPVADGVEQLTPARLSDGAERIRRRR
jgi:hypothetical protein